MKMLELLNDHPKTAIVVKQWMLNKLIDSLKDDSLPEDFKEIVRRQGIDNEKVANMVENSSRSLFDVFDEHKIYIETIVDELGGFWWKIGEIKSTAGYEYRINCDRAAIVEAFKLLEEKL
jgi:hypothetical protein